jgi:phage baseplate assembly protein V
MASDKQTAGEMQNIVRVGEITSINTKNATARVQFKDTDELVSFDLPIIFKSSLKNKNYKMPDIGEQVACMFQPNGLEEGFILGCVYNAKDKPPADDPDVDIMKYDDDAFFQYDRKNHKLTINVPGDIEIHASGAINIIADGPVKINGSIVDLNL